MSSRDSRASSIVAREHFQRDQVAEPHDRNVEAPDQFDRFRRPDDFGLDAG